MKVCIIGCGNIGASLAKELAQKTYPLSLCDQDQGRVTELANSLGVRGSCKISEASQRCDVIVVAVKPPVVSKVLTSLKDCLGEALAECSIISVAAGVSIAQMKESLGEHKKLVRVMPNLAMSVAQGMSAIYSSDRAASKEADILFSEVGRTLVLESEEQIAAATGVCGSGPAFISEAIRGLEEFALSQGFSAQASRLLASQTALGVSKLILETGLSPAEVNKQIATPGGTTAAGLSVLEEKGFASIIQQAAEAALKRAGEDMAKG